MISYSGYYYKDIWKDTAPSGHPLFVICAGSNTPVTLACLDCIHPSRSDYQLIYVKNGCLYYDDEAGVEQRADKNSFVLFKPKEWQAYRYYLKDKTEVLWAHFSGTYAEAFLKNHGIWDKRCIEIPENELYVSIFNNMIEELRKKRAHYEELCTLLLKELILSISREIEQSANKNEQKAYKEIDNIIRFLEEHYHEEIYLDELAQSQYISKSWLIRQFNEYVGMSPIKYLNKIRVEKAAQLLQSTNSIADISKAVGFTDQLYFSKVFKTIMGMSPSKYRECIK